MNNIICNKTKPFFDQKSGTSGLRKKTKVFLENENYLENYLQACINKIDIKDCQKEEPIIIGGDGRFYMKKAIQVAVEILIGNGFKNIIIAKDGMLSTPAASILIKSYNALFGFVFTASHNPAGIDGDFGVKLNTFGGGPASDSLSKSIYEESKDINNYFKTDNIGELDIEKEKVLAISGSKVTVISAVKEYADYMEKLFDFELLRNYCKDNQIIFDAMHAVTGPYAKEIFIKRLSVPEHLILNKRPSIDFSGVSPDPNPRNNSNLYELAKSLDYNYSLLIASDGDGDRNMILGDGVYVSPGDSLAIITKYSDIFPYLKDSIKGVARSMPTSRAVDLVCDKKGISCYETPTGWKYFFDLLEEDKAQLCGEESFGTSSKHCREKDGIWAGLCWLSILASERKTIKEILASHWKEYGRHYYRRHDFFNLKKEDAERLFLNIRNKGRNSISFMGKTPTKCEEFFYGNSPEEREKGQGFQVVFSENARFIARLSGTDTSGVTLRLYLELYEKEDIHSKSDVIMKPLVDLAKDWLEIKKYTNKDVANLIV